MLPWETRSCRRKEAAWVEAQAGNSSLEVGSVGNYMYMYTCSYTRVCACVAKRPELVHVAKRPELVHVAKGPELVCVCAYTVHCSTYLCE